MPGREGRARGGGETEIERGRECVRESERQRHRQTKGEEARERRKGRRGGRGAQHECGTVSLVTLWTAVRGDCDPQRYGRKSARAGVGEYRYENSPNGPHSPSHLINHFTLHRAFGQQRGMLRRCRRKPPAPKCVRNVWSQSKHCCQCSGPRRERLLLRTIINPRWYVT
jgi:hypothetical protein